MFEFHTALFDRARLQAIGGPDENVRTGAEHLDLALRVRSAGGSVWLEPASNVTYAVPQRLPLRDLPFFLGRWSPSWKDLSREAFNEKHGVNNPEDPYRTWDYTDIHRSYAWLPIGRAAAFVLRRPVSLGVARRFDRLVGARIAASLQRLAPRWRGAGLESPP